ncbi:MAG TPA: hypothetical protein PLP29_06675 [Candidatus Ozemobacteraceae bacterium]|nr:hypothetical protein [Candidatus Ozemobacteraceae bacterium]
MRTLRTIALLLTICLLATPSFAARRTKPATPAPVPVETPQERFEFTFYYQRIDEVVTVQRGTPAAAKAAIQERIDGAKRVPASDFRKKLLKADLTKEGRQEIPSDDTTTRYKVFVTKIRDEAHLLQLMGVATDTARLSDGQRGLLAAYRQAKEQYLLDRMKQGCRDRVEIVLTDTNGHDSDKVLRDFWPYSNGLLIQLNSMRYNNPDGEADARSTLVHEAAHSMDRTAGEADEPYGPDGVHHINEVTKPRAAFLEGWAEFMQMHDSPDLASWWPRVFEEVKIERSKGVYEVASASAVDGLTLTRVEGINALIILEISKLPDGMSRLYTSFRATNQRERTLANLLTDYVGRNPDQASAVARIFDERTYGKLTDAQLISFLGDSAGVKGYLTARAEAARAALVTTTPAEPLANQVPEAVPSTETPAAAEVEVRSNGGTNPFTGGTSE